MEAGVGEWWCSKVEHGGRGLSVLYANVILPERKPHSLQIGNQEYANRVQFWTSFNASSTSYTFTPHSIMQTTGGSASADASLPHRSSERAIFSS